MRPWFLLILMVLTTLRAPAAEVLDDTTSGVLALMAGAKPGASTRLGMIVLDAKTGESLLEYNADRAMRPASILKLATVAAALDILGPSHRFTTTVETRGHLDPKTGVLDGSLVLRGGGDPALGARFQKDRSDTTAVFRHWIEDLRAKGIRSIKGDIDADDTLFSGPTTAVGWNPLDRGEWFSAEVSALTFNDGCVDIDWEATGSPGDNPRMSVRPETPRAKVTNSVKIISPGDGSTSIRYFRSEKEPAIVARGRMVRGETRHESASVSDPARFAAAVFQEELRRAGIKQTGTIRLTRLEAAHDDGDTSGPVVLSGTVSPPLSEYVGPILRHSQNMYAESLLRSVAIARGQPATFAGGCQAVTDWLVENHLYRNGFAMLDGSGLSSLDQAPPRVLAEVLVHERNAATSRLFRSSLARPGEPGSLRERVPGLAGKLAAKTGHLQQANAMAGYLVNPRGRELAFVVVLNDFEAPREDMNKLVDRIVMELYGAWTY